MIKLYLVRHGRCDWNGGGDFKIGKVIGDIDRPITSYGIYQAQKVALSFSEGQIKINKAYSSPLSRAKETAETIKLVLSHFGQDFRIVETEEFKERNHGVTQGIDRIMAADYEKINSSYDGKFPNGESLRDLESRVKPKLIEILEKDVGNILIVSHNDVMRFMHRILTDCKEEETALKYFKQGQFYEYIK